MSLHPLPSGRSWVVSLVADLRQLIMVTPGSSRPPRLETHHVPSAGAMVDLELKLGQQAMVACRLSRCSRFEEAPPCGRNLGGTER